MQAGGHNVPMIRYKYGINKLTSRECFHFQGFPSNNKLSSKIPDGQLYK